MISFKQFISENDEEDSRDYVPQRVTSDDLIEWCEANCPRYLENLSNSANPRIDRGTVGVGSKRFAKIDTNKFNRVSANTLNFYTLWMDNHPDWSAYPKRSKSLICSTSIETAGGYGTGAYLVFPADKNKIGVCSANDLWFSFVQMFKALDNESEAMNTINSLVENIFKSLGIERQQIKQAERSYDEREKQCTADKIATAVYAGEVSAYYMHYYREPVKLMKNNGYDSLYDVWEANMDPRKNGFSTRTAGDFEDVSDDAEVWVQGECYLMDNDILSAPFTLRTSEPRLYEFLKAHHLDKITK
jgi:hypothetical protein